MQKAFIILMIIFSFFLFTAGTTSAQQKDVPLAQVPGDVIEVLNQYLKILTTAPSLDECAREVAKVSGGDMLNKSGVIGNDVKDFSLKKDYNNSKFYKVPAVITRVVLKEDDYDGSGPTLIRGNRYKIWVAKKDGVAGMPAPIPIIKPKTGAPKIVRTIGSL